MREQSRLGPKGSPLSIATELARVRRGFALAVGIEALGSTSVRPGSKAIFDPEGTQVASWVGGGCAESTVVHATVECPEKGSPQIVDVRLDDEVLGAGMPCGGSMRVYVEPIMPEPVLWIVGHGSIAESLCRLGYEMGLTVVLNDSATTPDRFPDVRELIPDDSVYGDLKPASGEFVVIATQHRGDHQPLRRVLATDVGYIALIVSKNRAGLVFDNLREAGFDQKGDRLRSLTMRFRDPCQTPEEIALSIISEIVFVGRRRSLERPAQASRTPTPLSLAS